MKTLSDFASDQRLIGALCRKRIELARKNRRVEFISRSARSYEETPSPELMTLLPPRRHWPRLLKRERATAQSLPTAQAKRLEQFVLRKLSHPERRRWTRELRTFLDTTRARILEWTAGETIRPDRFIPIRKPGKGTRYRVLAPYALRDAIADSVFASYLRYLVDTRLDRHCYAFRLPNGGAPLTHHDAVADLRNFAADSPSRLWVAECDIKGFFDSVSHDETKRMLTALLAEIDSPVDPRLLGFIDSFLAGYDYRVARENVTRQLAKRNIESPDIYDPVAALKKARMPIQKPSRIGIPQGSALSSVLANVVLTHADRAVRRRIAEHRRTFYARYVDDILLVSTNRRIATTGLNAYRRALRELKLPEHAPDQVENAPPRARRLYWQAKSKAPYRWTPAEQCGVEWIGFLGYQMKRDGTLRIRLSSIEKELGKQRKAIDDIISAIDKKRLRCKRDQQVHTISRVRRIRYVTMLHLVSISVGYPSLPLVWPTRNSVCWTSGFRLLREGKRDLSLLKALDRGRGIALKALKARLRSLATCPEIEEVRAHTTASGLAIKYDGRPLSYYAQFASNPRVG